MQEVEKLGIGKVPDGQEYFVYFQSATVLEVHKRAKNCGLNIMGSRCCNSFETCLKFATGLANVARISPCFDIVEELAWSNDPESYASFNIATGRTTQAIRVKGDDPGKKRYPGPPGGVLGLGLKAPHHKK